MENIEKLIKLLKSKDLDNWKINLNQAKSKNFYYTKNLEPEEIVEGDRTDIEVTIYKNLNNTVGESSFSVIGFDKKRINKKIKDAIQLCKLSQKKKYNLTTQDKYPKLKQKCNKLLNPNKRITTIYNKIAKEIRKHKNIIPNNLEVHTILDKTRVINSQGVDCSSETTSFFVELTITARQDSKEQTYKEQEFVASKEMCSPEKFEPEKFVKDNLRIVKDVLNSTTIPLFSGNILLSGDAVAEFFAPNLSLNPIVLHGSAKIAHMGISRYNTKNKKTKIADLKADKISIYLNPLLNLNPASAKFDNDGVPSKRVELIKEGSFKNYFAAKQYADYLNIEPTGAMGSIEIKKGTHSTKNLRKTPYIEIVSFSSFVPNSISGDFSAEIRLGYLVKKIKGKIVKQPFKGGMFTGNVFSLLKFIYLSKETKQETGYLGPKIVKFGKAVVAGLK